MGDRISFHIRKRITAYPVTKEDLFMSRIRYATTLEADLIKKAKETAKKEGLEGANAVIEKALKLYFANSSVVVWEKRLSKNWLNKLVLRPDKAIFESIRVRKVLDYTSECYEPSAMEDKGWNKVWHMKPVHNSH